MENLNKRPSKGILRFSEGSSRSNSVEKDIKWDETNIKETLHPDDKDYGFMRIDEPPTPFSRSPGLHSGENSEDEEDMQNRTSDLLQRASKKIQEPPVTIENVEGLLDEVELELDEDPSDISSTSGVSGHSGHKNDFELKRKRHYNEFHAVKLAKKLMERELDEDDDDDGPGQGEEADMKKSCGSEKKP